MKNRLRLACLGLVLVAATAHAGSPLELLERKLTKYATPYLDAYNKGLCTCTEAGSSNDRLVGRLRYGIFAPAPYARHVKVWCQVTRYDALGDPASTSSCATFQPLAS